MFDIDNPNPITEEEAKAWLERLEAIHGAVMEGEQISRDDHDHEDADLWFRTYPPLLVQIATSPITDDARVAELIEGDLTPDQLAEALANEVRRCTIIARRMLLAFAGTHRDVDSPARLRARFMLACLEEISRLFAEVGITETGHIRMDLDHKEDPGLRQKTRQMGLAACRPRRPKS
ncbi:MAG: hypothetical protein KC910_35775 [Candidatus Eremiobacteraeota bacterium]|nr:hypothetical protein [Candidatus Eremiobacteraeota bacterium]